MGNMRALAGQTAIYGVSSIVGRVMNFLLTPLYTREFTPDKYGIVTELYAYVAFLIVLLTYGMETAFFRFGSQAKDATERNRIFSTAFIAVLATSLTFIALISLNVKPIAQAMGYGDNSLYITFFAWIIGLDAMVTIPLARLRLLQKPFPFAGVNLISILINIGLNLFFILYCPIALEDPESLGYGLISTYYNPAFGIGYIFLANLVSSIAKFALLLPWIGALANGFFPSEFKRLLPYALPLLFLGLAGIINETFDRAFFTMLSGLNESDAKEQLGIYGACYKVAMLLTIGIQAYRFAAEPFIFSLTKGEARDLVQADIMKYYFIAASIITLGILCFLDIALLLVGESFREGRGVIPILLMAYLCFGAVFNLSFWYKLNDKTMYGAAIAFTGAAITVLVNVIAVPQYGYYGSAWATFLAYAGMLILSYILGQKHHYVPYPNKRILEYLVLGGTLYALHSFIGLNHIWKYLSGVVVVLIYISFILKRENLLQRILKQ